MQLRKLPSLMLCILAIACNETILSAQSNDTLDASQVSTWHIKWSTSRQINIVNPATALAVEHPLSKRWSLQHELGYIYRQLDRNEAEPEANTFRRGLLWSEELRYYLSPSNNERIKKLRDGYFNQLQYLSFRVRWIEGMEERAETLCAKAGETCDFLRFSNYTFRNSNIAFTVGGGMIEHLSSKWLVEAGLEIGIMIDHIRLEGISDRFFPDEDARPSYRWPTGSPETYPETKVNPTFNIYFRFGFAP